MEKWVQQSIVRARRAVRVAERDAFQKLRDFYEGDHAEHTGAMLRLHCADDSLLALDTTMHRYVPLITAYVNAVCVGLIKEPALVLVDRSGNEVARGGHAVEAWSDICRNTNLYAALSKIDWLQGLGRTAFMYVRPRGDLLHFDALDRNQVLVDEHSEFPTDLAMARAVVIPTVQPTQAASAVYPLSYTAWCRAEDGSTWWCYQVDQKGRVLGSVWPDGVNRYEAHPVALFSEWEPDGSVYLPLDKALLQTQLVHNKNATVIDESVEYASTGQKVLEGNNVGASRITLGARRVLELLSGEKFRVEKSDANVAGMTAAFDRSVATEIGMRGLPVTMLSSSEPANNTGAAQLQRRASQRDARNRREPQLVRNIENLFRVVRRVWNVLHPERKIDPEWSLKVALAYSEDMDPSSRQADAQARQIDYQVGVDSPAYTYLARRRIDWRSATEEQLEAARREVARNAGLYRVLVGQQVSQKHSEQGEH